MAAARAELRVRYSTDDPDYGEYLYDEAVFANMVGSHNPGVIVSGGIRAAKADARDKIKDIISAWAEEDVDARTIIADQLTVLIDDRFWEGCE